nr:hypothetical protein [Streptomyces sp. TLI_146]
MVSRLGQVLAGIVGEHGVDLDAGDLLTAEAVGQQCAVVDGAGADFQHRHPLGYLEGFQHAGHHTGHAG